MMSKYSEMDDDELGVAVIELFERGVIALESLAAGLKFKVDVVEQETAGAKPGIEVP